MSTDTYEYDAPPLPPIFTSLPVIQSDTSPSWEFVGEPGASFQCQLAQGSTVLIDFRPCSSPYTIDLSGLPDGAYTLSVRAIDAMGGPGALAVAAFILDRSGSSTVPSTAAPVGGRTGTPRSGRSVTPLGPTSAPAPDSGAAPGTFEPGGATQPPPARYGGRGRASNPEPTNLWEIFTSISRVLQFPLLLLLLVIAFLIIQDRIDRSDPKLSLAPVYGDPNVGFEPPPRWRHASRLKAGIDQ